MSNRCKKCNHTKHDERCFSNATIVFYDANDKDKIPFDIENLFDYYTVIVENTHGYRVLSNDDSTKYMIFFKHSQSDQKQIGKKRIDTPRHEYSIDTKLVGYDVKTTCTEYAHIHRSLTGPWRGAERIPKTKRIPVYTHYPKYKDYIETTYVPIYETKYKFKVMFCTELCQCKHRWNPLAETRNKSCCQLI